VTDIYEYWIGKGVDYDAIWRAHDSGEAGYLAKFQSMEVHALRIEFSTPPLNLPLHNQEAIFKTTKGYFHDMKQLCLSSAEYGSAGPLFLYSVERGSSVWYWLGELKRFLPMAVGFAEDKIMGEHLDHLDKRMKFLKDNFGNDVDPKLFAAFVAARTPKALDQALKNLIKNKIVSVQVSRSPFKGNMKTIEASFVELKSAEEGDLKRLTRTSTD
jgi:hypothetical protein